ncbi:ferritin-like domain-containing protein [Segetibacter koreensis]|uniref:YciE/YciF ferroxidase family protein n=1 Tax=Segetibacter koreensis TaxID=398037 RepID=UPI0003742503|nr:DUF892 family protein [Segetibacter koreensis]
MIQNLKDLFIYQLQNLYASENYMLTELPVMIEKAQHGSLKNALDHHLRVTKEQKERLEKVVSLINKNDSEQQVQLNKEHVCKGMNGLIEEANNTFEAGVEKDVTDRAIIAFIQKMEHYEISSYGTAIAYAHQLHMPKAAELLRETLNEEYEADDLLTALATAGFNKEAIPEDAKLIDETSSGPGTDNNEPTESSSQIHITERTINSPGGRAGTSHRSYGSGESRGH